MSKTRVRQLPGGGRAVEVAPHRVAGWFERFADGHGGARNTLIQASSVTVRACDGARAVLPVPFAPLSGEYGERDGLAIASLVEHVTRPRRIGLLLVRLGAHSVGISYDGVVETSSTDRHLVHGRNKAGGWSQQRFARRRAGQSRRSLDAAADAAARILLPVQAKLDGLVLGGDRQALDVLKDDPRLKELLARAQERVLDVPEPRRAVLDDAAQRAVAVEIHVYDP